MVNGKEELAEERKNGVCVCVSATSCRKEEYKEIEITKEILI